MIFLLTIPAIAFFTFQQLIASGFPNEGCDDPRGFLGWAFLIFVGCSITALISLVPLGVSAWIGSLPKTTGKKDHDYPLIALRQKDGADGSFFLGSGFVKDAQYYFWYRKDGDHISGGKTRRQPGVRIYESNTDNPFMRTWKCAYKSQMADKYLWLVGIDMRDDDDFCPDFHIPRGSIQEGFSL